MTPKSPRFLVIRRDNIGDLVCTTPLLAAIRQTYPGCWIGVFANSYNAPVLEGNPDIDAVLTYRKRKHGEIGFIESLIERLRLVGTLRALQLDWVIVAAPAFQPRSIRLAWLLRARNVAAFMPAGAQTRSVTAALPLSDMTGHAEAELVFRFAPLLGLNSATPPPPRVVPAEDAVRRVRAALEPSAGGPLLGIHISARKPSQRWPVERFAQLMRALHGLYGARFLLFWAPGAATDAKHPGDDEKAALLREATRDLPVTPWQTSELRDLIAGIAVCDAMILGDGGAMHLAAGLGKPIVCLFGQSDAQRWRPWRVPYRLLQPDSRSVADITIEQVLTTYNSLMQSCQAPARLSCPVQEGPVSPLPDATR